MNAVTPDLDPGVETTQAAAEPALTIDSSRQFIDWLVEHRLSLAFTTYQSGKLFFIGVKPAVSQFEE